MHPSGIPPLPKGTSIVDPEAQETWVIAYCEAVAHNDPFGPYAYGLVNGEDDECVVFHTRVNTDRNPAILLPCVLPPVLSNPAA